MPNFHDHRGVVDNGLNDGLDFLKDIVRQAKEIDPDVDYVFVFDQRTIESALYQKNARMHFQFNPAHPAQLDIVYCHNMLANIDTSKQDGICNKTGLSFYQIKMALCRLFANGSKRIDQHSRLQRILFDHASGSGMFYRRSAERLAFQFFTE